MRPQRRCAQQRWSKENAEEVSLAGAQRKAEAGSAASQQPRRGVHLATSQSSPAAALAAWPLGNAESGGDDAQAALRQLAALTVDGAEGLEEEEDEEEPSPSQHPQEQQQQQQQGNGQHPLQQPRWPPAPAPTSSIPSASGLAAPGDRTRSEEAEVEWLAAMELSPLVDLRALGSPLALGGPVQWGGNATPAPMSATTTPVLPLRLGTPLSQAKGLPYPSDLDFGAPSVPQGGWAASLQRPRHTRGGGAGLSRHAAGTAAAAAVAAEAANQRPLRPQARAESLSIPSVVMTMPLRPATHGAGAPLVPVPVMQPPLRVPPVAVATAATFARLPSPEGCVVVLRGPSATSPIAPGPAVPAPNAAPAHPVPQLIAPVPANLAGAEPSAGGASRSARSGGRSQQERPRRQRRQLQRSAEFHWSDSEEEEEEAAVDTSDEEEEEGVAEAQQELEADAAPAKSDDSGGSAWRTPINRHMAASRTTSGSPAATNSDGSVSSDGSSGPNRGGSGSSEARRAGGSGSRNTGSGSSRAPARKKARAASASASRLQQTVQQQQLLRQLQDLMRTQTAQQAAATLDCSTAGFRTLCRSVGIQRWPSRRPGSATGS